MVKTADVMYKSEYVLVEDLNQRLTAGGFGEVDHVGQALANAADRRGYSQADRDELASILTEFFAQYGATYSEQFRLQWLEVRKWVRKRVSFAHPLGDRSFESEEQLNAFKAEAAAERDYDQVRAAIDVLLRAADIVIAQAVP